MLDELLGRAALKERIADLEEENRHLQRQLDAEQERRAEAASARQDADERVNRLQDRIADLEGKVAGGDDDADLAYRHTETLRGGRLAAVLDRLESVATDAEGAFTAVVDDGHDLPDAVENAFGDHAGLIARAAPCLAVTDDAGVVGACLSVPDRPAPFASWSDGFAFERTWFEPRGQFALALVRSDLFALGVYDGRERTAFQGFDSDLKSEHSKGGFSQARFERLRDAQIRDHVDRCREALSDVPADRLYVVGERSVVGEFTDRADATATVDATGEPEAALDDAFRAFWTVRLRVP
ncbi:MAG: Vms1/Ankzf1 family peptidyl-tRNA hydrolase [Haloarculaceae archaeon]